MRDGPFLRNCVKTLLSVTLSFSTDSRQARRRVIRLIESGFDFAQADKHKRVFTQSLISRLPKVRWFYLVLLFVILAYSKKAEAEIQIWIPDTTVCCGTDFFLPVMVKGITQEDSILAYQFNLVYDASLIHIQNIKQSGSLTESWGEPIYNIDDGMLRVAGFTADKYMAPVDSFGDPFVYIEFAIEIDSTCQTPIQFNECLFFNQKGEVPIDSLYKTQLNVVLNFPPQIIGFGSYSLPEDGLLNLHWKDFIQDVNDPLDNLNIQFSLDPPYTFEPDSIELGICIRPPENWSGSGSLKLYVNDPFDQSDSDTALIQTLPIPDPPGAFRLVYPSDDTLITDLEGFDGFSWQVSKNVDEEDVILYRFYLSMDSLFGASETIQVFGISGTSLNLSQPLSAGMHFWMVQAEDGDGFVIRCDEIFKFQVSGINKVAHGTKPRTLNLYQNMPNPFNMSTSICFDLPKDDHVTLFIYNHAGRMVKKFLDKRLSAGIYHLDWHGLDYNGNPVASGCYIIRFHVDGHTQFKKMTLLK